MCRLAPGNVTQVKEVAGKRLEISRTTTCRCAQTHAPRTINALALTSPTATTPMLVDSTQQATQFG